MKRLSVALLFPLLAGCATLGLGGTSTQPTAEQAALTNLVMALIGASTGVYLNNGSCATPPIPPEVLVPCAPLPATAPPEQVQTALQNCVVNSAVLVALTKFQQRVCPTPGLPVVTTK